MSDVPTPARVDPRVLIDTLPLGVVVTDLGGTIVDVNHRAKLLSGYTRDEMRGRSMLDFIAPDDLPFVIASLTEGPAYRDVVIGPSRIRYIAADGAHQWTEYWGHSCPPELGVDGWVITLSTEAVTDHLAQAVRDIALGEPLGTCLAAIAAAIGAYPVNAEGAILVPTGQGSFDVIGVWPTDAPASLSDPALPWHQAVRTAGPADVLTSSLPEPLAGVAQAAGFLSVWVRPVVADSGETIAVFVAWRDLVGPPSTNQDRHLAEAVGVARLAISHDRLRRQLQRAALVDPLTGAGNRLGLRRRLDELGDRPFGVLFIDLDGFKSVNDADGHDVGDVVLAAASHRIAAVVRGPDAVFRLGGDEFVVLCEARGRHIDTEVVEQVADRVVVTLGQSFRVDDERTVDVGASVGATVRREGEPPEAAIQRADRALLLAKRSGKGQWRLAVDD